MSEAVEAEALYGLVKVKLIYMERSHSLVECTGLENRRPARVRGFESHPLRQNRRSTILLVMCSVGKSITPKWRSYARVGNPDA